MSKTFRATATKLIPKVFIKEQDWHASVIQKLAQPSSSVIARELKDFVLKNRDCTFETVVEY